MRPRVTIPLVIGMVLLAGCAGFGLDSGTSTTTTPAETTTPTPQYPPGITPDGVSEPFTLSNAHAAALQGQSYSVNETYQIEYSNGTLYTIEVVSIQITASEKRYLYTSTVRGTASRFLGGSNGTLAYYSNGSVVLRKVERGTETSYRIMIAPNGEPVPPTELFPGTPTNDERIAVLLGALSNVSVTRQGDSLYRITAASLSRDTLEVDEIPITNVTAVQFTATVTASGLVREYRLSYVGQVNGHEVAVSEHIQYDAIGTTSVEQPPWYENATENTTNPTE